jgi:ABC-type polysaccharide/polyol phosphate export permease
MRALWRDTREMLAEQLEYRELLMQMVRRDLILRYKQTVMGVGWAVFMPLVNTAVFSVIFVRVAPLQTEVPYPVFAFCGLLVWNFFASSLRFSVISLTSNTNLVTKIYFPREIFPFSCLIVALVDFAIGGVVLAGLMLYYRVGISPTLWLLPAVLVVHLAFTAGVALLVAMANLFYRDVKYLFEVALSIWMFSTSVVYPVELVGGTLGRVLALNPMTPILGAYRDVMLLGRQPFTPAFAAAGMLSFATLLFAWIVFHRAEFRFAESI